MNERDRRISFCFFLFFYFSGKDYYNPSVSPPSKLDEVQFDQFDRSKNPRMPWQDVHIAVEGEAAKDVALNFIQR